MARPPLDVTARAPSPRVLVAGATAVVCLPLLIAVVAFRRPVWTPVLDLAMTELRVRDVGGGHTPLIGLPGRIGTLERQGSHPGPLSFYALAPTYRLLGSSAWALQVGSFLVHATAIATALAIAARRAGAPLVVGVTALLALLTTGYGGGTLTEPWNPYLPLLWWVVVLLAAWSVLCGDLPMLPVVVAAGSFCAQTHVPYLGLSLGIGALALAGAVIAGRDPAQRGRTLRWVMASVGVGLVLWLPPTVDQVRRDPGNYDLLLEHFSDPPEEVKGLGAGLREGLQFFDLAYLLRADAEGPAALVTASDGLHPSSARGAALLVAWAVAAGVAVARRRTRTVVALHAVVAAATVLMVLAISRIFGVIWYYLTLWGWAIGLLALLATTWTAALEVGERRTLAQRAVLGRWATAVVAVLAVLVVARFAVEAPDSAHADPTVVRDLAAVVDDVADGLRHEEGAATGTDGRYLVTWSDALHIGSQGYGLLSELERRGFDVGLQASRRVPATAHRVLPPDQATARIHLATGAFVAEYTTRPDAVEVARFDPRTPADRVEQAELRTGIIDELVALGREDLVAAVDDNLFGAAIDEGLPEQLRQRMGQMLELGGPLAVFILPPGEPDR